ncbi:GEVED domain-containing protein [Psychroflexus sediminis]|uniref:Por secretion system C-terminal sorting domain-containing protein n=1 Tax=Psychroflexus sediminis TaxID=470826 RepID=A0A1G7ULL5_9FLAO|nr:GEVED domain-containing protein [Psychroflexus sediminis]SDG48121.1 Por secretion system C-terminal sorting domain-containing protein [Psychroflexus sediminis]
MIQNLLNRATSLVAIVGFSLLGVAQTAEKQAEITSSYNTSVLNTLEKEFKSKSEQQDLKIRQYVKSNSVQTELILEDGGYAQLQRIEEDGSLIYYRTYNVASARSTRVNHVNSGGSLGLSLDGQNMISYVWDGGHPRVTHQEYDGVGGSNRVSIQDATAEGGVQLNFHAAHVTGTILASGVVANAKGMAPQAKAKAYKWNDDLAEATSAAGSGMLISNHSYGYNSEAVPDYYFGAYIGDSRDWDNLQYNAPYYLMVVAAGNDGTATYNASPLNPTYPQYDKLTGHSVSKNTMVVASAQDASIDTSGNLVSVNISSFSSQGPTDDYRIKPDITGNGQGVYSTYDNSDTAYNSISGTSMASPNVAGSLLLLQQHANNTTGNYLKASTLKGIALHTADDAGSTGPDAIFGWGLMNTKRAAEAISNNGQAALISELTLASGQSYSVEVESDGVNDLLASISWTDPAGTTTTTLNSSEARLVNDLDIRVTKNSTSFLPWRLTGVNTNGKGDNTRDPIERVDVSNASGTYTITVTHKGSLSSGSQDYSLVVTGLTSAPVACDAVTPAGLAASGIGSNTAILNWNSVDTATYAVRYRPSGTSTWTTTLSDNASMTLEGLTAETTYEAQVKSICGSSSSAYSSSISFTTTAQELVYCDSKGNSVADEYIGNFELNTIANSSGGGNGYSDFTSISAALASSQTYSFTITPAWTGTVYNEGYALWIDYNKDGDFTDAGELVFSKAASNASSVTGSFTVPSTVVEGATRLRVSMKYNAIPGSCEAFSYGEVEDYTVNLSANAADTQAPSTPTAFAASNVTETSVSLSWNASTDNIGVEGYEILQGSSVLGSTANTSVEISGLSAGTAYTFAVRAKDAAGNTSASATLSVTTTSSVTYCTSSGNNSSYEWIDFVGLNNISKTSADDSGYADHTNLVANLPYGSNTIQISAGFSGQAYTEFWKVWIDYNKNGVFETSELVVSGSSSSAANLSATFNVPATAISGPTRMRVSMKYNAAQTACESFAYGEVEDYTVNVGQATSTYATLNATERLGNETAPLGMQLYPNPLKGNFVKIKASSKTQLNYSIFDLSGRELSQGQVRNQSIPTHNLSTGVYLIKLDDGQKSFTRKLIKE